MPPARLTRVQRRLAIGLVLGVTLVAFETTAVITALPTITDELGGDSLYGADPGVYTLANLVALVAAGELADRRGPSAALPPLHRRRSSPACVVAAAAPSMTVVVVGRVLQGAGTGGFGPIAYLLVKRAFPDEPAGRRCTRYLSAGWVLPSLVRPCAVGAVTEQFGWRVGVPRDHPVRRCGRCTRRPTDARVTDPCRVDRVGSRVADRRWLGAVGRAARSSLGLQFANPFAAVLTIGGRRSCVMVPSAAPTAARRLLARPPRTSCDHRLSHPRHRHVPRRRQLRPARRRPHPRRQPDGAGLRHHRRRGELDRRAVDDRRASTTRSHQPGRAGRLRRCMLARARLVLPVLWAAAGRCGRRSSAWAVGGLGHGSCSTTRRRWRRCRTPPTAARAR